MKPQASTPQRRKASNSSMTYRGSARPPSCALLGEGREVIAHEGMHDPVADGVAGANVGVCTAVGHRWVRGQSDRRAVADPLCLR
jgi:hypothetical protein